MYYRPSHCSLVWVLYKTSGWKIHCSKEGDIWVCKNMSSSMMGGRGRGRGCPVVWVLKLLDERAYKYVKMSSRTRTFPIENNAGTNRSETGMSLFSGGPRRHVTCIARSCGAMRKASWQLQVRDPSTTTTDDLACVLYCATFSDLIRERVMDRDRPKGKESIPDCQTT